MRIIGENKDSNIIIFRHNGNNFRFKCCTNPSFNEGRNLAEENVAIIEFSDLMEVDSLIGILKRFKKESCEYIGEWK